MAKEWRVEYGVLYEGEDILIQDEMAQHFLKRIADDHNRIPALESVNTRLRQALIEMLEAATPALVGDWGSWAAIKAEQALEGAVEQARAVLHTTPETEATK